MNKQPGKCKWSNLGMHFPGVICCFFGLFIACIVFLTVFLGSYSLDDVQSYKRLMHGDEDPALIEKSYVSSQQRSGLQKDVLLSGKEGRLEVRLISDSSELALEHRGGRVSIVEKMKDVTCFMQEEVLAIMPDGRKAIRQPNGLYLLEGADSSLKDSWLSADLNLYAAKPMQLVRRLDAKEATYHYRDDLFVAENVVVGRYLIPGHDLYFFDEKYPLMRGVAESVKFSLRGCEKCFQAHRLRATFYTTKG